MRFSGDRTDLPDLDFLCALPLIVACIQSQADPS